MVDSPANGKKRHVHNGPFTTWRQGRFHAGIRTHGFAGSGRFVGPQVAKSTEAEEVGPRRDDDLPGRDRGRQRDPRRGRLLPRVAREGLPRLARAVREGRAGRRDHAHRRARGTRGARGRRGGRVRLHELAALVPASANAAHDARIDHETATLRGLIRAGGEIARLGWERPGETGDLVDQAEQILYDLSQQRVTGEWSEIEELLKESFERITQLYESGVDLTGTPSGFRDLDRLTSGFQPGNLIIVAARPSMGKSALALCMAANMGVRHNTAVGLFTLEMSKSEVTQRLMCSEAKVESNRLRNGKLDPSDWPRLTAACDKLAKAPIWVDDTGSINMMDIRSKARRLKSRHPDLGLIIVDYLQLLTPSQRRDSDGRVQEVSEMSRSLKILARDLDVPIVALSQLSRAVEQRTDKRPILSDLRESGSIEQDADLVAFVYRDEYYNEESDQQGLAEVNLASAAAIRRRAPDQALLPQAVREVLPTWPPRG